MSRELKEYAVKSWITRPNGETILHKFFTTGDKEEANKHIEELPEKTEYKLYERVWKNKF